MSAKVFALDRSFPWIPMGAAAVVMLLAIIRLIEVDEISADLRISEDGVGRGGVILSDLRREESSEDIRGELILKDPTPLFLPTRWNSGRVEARLPAERAPGASFRTINAKLVFSDDAVGLQLPDGITMPTTPLSVLEQVDSTSTRVELHQRDEIGVVLPQRVGFLEVSSVANGRVLYEHVIEEQADVDPLMVPVEAVLTVNEVGIWVRPTVIEAPDRTAVDIDQINFLLQRLRLETVLEAGIYRIYLGP